MPPFDEDGFPEQSESNMEDDEIVHTGHSKAPETPRKSILVKPGTPKKLNGSVSFSTVSVNVHPMVLGDNPSVSSGLPVTIGCLPIHCSTENLDAYEKSRADLDGQPRSRRKTKQEMRLSIERRTRLLLARGHSQDSFRRVAEEIIEIKAQRKATARQVKRQQNSSQSKPFLSRLLKKFTGSS